MRVSIVSISLIASLTSLACSSGQNPAAANVDASSGANNGTDGGGTGGGGGSTGGGGGSGGTDGGNGGTGSSDGGGSKGGGGTDGGGTSGGGGSDAAVNTNPGGTNIDGGYLAGAFTYTPVGCSYSISPPASDTYTQMAYDDSSSIGTPANAVPTRVRLGLGGGTTEGSAGYADPTTSIAFTWETSAYNHAAEVRFGTSSASLTTVQTGYVWTTPGLTGDTTLFPTYMHEVDVCGLTPGTTYYYQVGGGPSGADEWSAVQTFTTVPAPSTKAITIGVVGDARDVVTTWAAVQGRMKQVGVALEIISGDIVDVGADEDDWISWLNAVSVTNDAGTSSSYAALGTIMMAPISGNHEDDSPFFFGNWAMPGSGTYAETYYSFNVGSAHIVMVDDTQISSGVPYSTEAQAQLNWITADLAAANADRTNHPFIITMSHRGMYSSSEHATDVDVIATRTALAPIYATYNVDLVLNGHDHIYERSMKLAPASTPSENPVAGVTTYVICAGSGADPYDVTDTSSPFITVAAPFGSAATSGSAAASYLGVYGTIALTPTSLVFTSYGVSPSGSASTDPVVDTFTLSPQ